MTPCYHFPHNRQNVYFEAETDYPNLSILKGDLLYIRPFAHDPNKIGLIIVINSGKNFIFQRYEGPDAEINGTPVYLVVGLTRIDDPLQA